MSVIRGLFDVEQRKRKRKKKTGTKGQKKVKGLRKPAKPGKANQGCGTGSGGFSAGNQCAIEDGIPQQPLTKPNAAKAKAKADKMKAKADKKKAAKLKKDKITSAKTKAKKTLLKKAAQAKKVYAKHKAKQATKKLNISSVPPSVRAQIEAIKASDAKLPISKTPKSIKQEIEEYKAAQKKAVEDAKKAEAAEKLAQENAQKEAAAKTAKKGKPAPVKDVSDGSSKMAKHAAEKVQDTEVTPNPDNLTEVKSLGGSTGAKLVQDKDGNQFVLKTGKNSGHIASESMADDLYEAAGVLVPKQQLHLSDGEFRKVAEYIKDAKTLGELKISNPKKFDIVKRKLQKDFVTDALLGNRDVIGQDMDNILVKGAKVYRVDNGGSLRYRAQGDTKAFDSDVMVEVKGLRDSGINAQAAEIYGELKDADISRQITKLAKKESQILAAAKTSSIRNALKSRMETLKNWQKDYKATKGTKQKTLNIIKGKVHSGYAETSAEMSKFIPKGVPKTAKSDWKYNSTVGDKIWKEHLTNGEKNAIEFWAKGNHDNIQDFETGFGRESYDSAVKMPAKAYAEEYKNFTTALQKMPSHRGTMYRGMDKIKPDQLRSIVSSGRYQNRKTNAKNSIHSSFTTAESVAIDFSKSTSKTDLSVIIKVSKPKRAKNLMGTTKNYTPSFLKEKEVVALPGAKYIVKNHKVFDPKTKKKMSAGSWAKKQAAKRPDYDIFKDTTVRHYIETEEVWDFD